MHWFWHGWWLNETEHGVAIKWSKLNVFLLSGDVKSLQELRSFLQCGGVKNGHLAKWNVVWFVEWNEWVTYAVRCWGWCNEWGTLKWKPVKLAKHWTEISQLNESTASTEELNQTPLHSSPYISSQLRIVFPQENWLSMPDISHRLLFLLLCHLWHLLLPNKLPV